APGCGNWIIGSAGGNIGFTDSNQPATLTLGNNAPSAAYFGIGTLGAALGNPGSGANVTSVIKTGASGTWELAGANSYTGNTTISAGILTLTSTGTLKFAPGANDICNKVTGAGTANFNGTFNIDTTNADTTNLNTWTLVDVTTKTYSLVGVTGFTNSSGVWTKVDGTKTWTFTQSTGVLSLANAGGTTYTVTFNNNDGGSDTMSAQTGSSAATLTSNTFTRTGYTFAGWNTASTGLGTAYADAASYAFTANATMYAQWTGNSYTVTFDSNGGDAASPTSKSVTNASAYGSLATVTRTGYTFNGWFTATSGGTQVTSGSTVAITGAQTLYAQWSISNYTVSFNMDGGSPTISSQSVQYNTTATQPSDPTKTGNTFAGWYSDAGLTTSFSFSTLITADIALYAKWTPVTTYQVTFDSNGGSSVSAQTVNDGSTATQPTAPTLANNTFAGWYTDNTTFANPFNFSTAIIGDITLYAKWTATPTLTLADTLVAVNTTYGTPSATPTSFHVSGSGLTGAPGNLTVTPPSGYEVSLSSGAGYSTSLSVPYSSGTLAYTQIYVRLAATAGVAGSPYSGTITVSGGGASSQTLATASSTVAKATATVVVTPYTVTYDGSAHSATVTSITGVNGETGATVGTVTLNTTHTTGGTYASDSWSFTGANYNDIGTSTTTVTVANGSFETTASGPGAPWFKFGSPWSITSSPSNYQVIQAVAGGVFSSTVAGGGTYIGLINEDDCPITAPLVQNLGTSVAAGDTLSVTFYIGRQSGAAAGGAGVAYFDVAGTKYTMAFDTSGMTAGTWQLETFTQTITNSGNLSLGFYGTSAHTINAWIDKISDVSRTSGGTPQTLTDTINPAGSSVTAPTVGTYTYTGSPQGPNSGATATGSTGAVTYSYSNSGGTSYGPSATQPTN
ncbi:MAG: InlB B-repeat-containing protein, partial [Verrucomicrobiota bacterium]